MNVHDVQRELFRLKQWEKALSKPIILDEDHFIEAVLLKYIEVESIPKVIDFIRENDLRKYNPKTGGTSAFLSNDISQIIQNSDEGILTDIALSIFKRNKKAISKRYN